MKSPPLVMSIVSGCLALGVVSGCGVFEEVRVSEPGPAYPSDVPKGEVLDIQVFRDVTLMRFTNTTTNAFGPSVVWLNQRYSSPIGGIAPGETVEMNLIEFVDEYGDTYRAGGFFAQRVPEQLVLVQLETDLGEGPELIGLIVVENRYQ